MKTDPTIIAARERKEHKRKKKYCMNALLSLRKCRTASVFACVLLGCAVFALASTIASLPGELTTPDFTADSLPEEISASTRFAELQQQQQQHNFPILTQIWLYQEPFLVTGKCDGSQVR